ncbi:alpha/beta hydrolase [Planotetraspora sp. A-T 1434]|uniref:alpha/beta fold hydrolase n=1 Tax=Planotetraspora sp. A-T 1434 TaxID=2979219 RepID=UPI0021BE0BCC|nr:alpha/beta hydrolase [Planotetraspora sp. A-T 1434]MCT9934482.1 alpha/beta hydrolase [Planotetraspora sp. A-T 1434]
MNGKSSARPFRTRTARIGALAAAAVLAATLPTGAAQAAQPRSDGKPTIVLEHGAFADTSSWNGVIERLRRDGYRVVAAANPLRGPEGDAAYLRSIVDHVQGPVVLAGHSYGGSVISKAADRNPKVKALVYIAAFIPEVGESATELTGKFPGSTLASTIDPVPYSLPDGETGTDLYIKQDKYRQQFAADVPASVAAVAAAGQRPIAAAALEEKATGAAWKTIPSWTLIALQDLNIPPEAQRFMAKRAHSHTVEVKASHAVPVSRPDAVTRLIEQAAKATAK